MKGDTSGMMSELKAVYNPSRIVQNFGPQIAMVGIATVGSKLLGGMNPSLKIGRRRIKLL